MYEDTFLSTCLDRMSVEMLEKPWEVPGREEVRWHWIQVTLAAPVEEGSQGSRKGTGFLVLGFDLGAPSKGLGNPQEGPDPFENYWIKNRVIWATGLGTDLKPKNKILMVILEFRFPSLTQRNLPGTEKGRGPAPVMAAESGDCNKAVK